MICPECKKVGLESCIYEKGAGFTTAMFFAPFYDEDGKRHHHDGNTTTTSYVCSEGHQFSFSRQGSCWCGWPKEGAYAQQTTTP